MKPRSRTVSGTNGKKTHTRRASASRPQPSSTSRNLGLMVGKILSGLFVATAIALSGFGLYKAYPYVNPDIKQVVVKGELIRLDQSALSRAVYENLHGGILTLDIEYLQSEVSKIAWVESVEIIKHFPSTLAVHIVEEQAVVRWNDQGYISNAGEFIESRLYEGLADLPLLASAVEAQDPELAAHQAVDIFHRLNSTVLMYDQTIRELRQSPSGGWTMIWDNGLSIDLGRTDHLNRTRHVMAAWQRLPADVKGNIDRIDARYGNGVAIRSRSEGSTSQSQQLSGKQHLNVLAQLI